MKLLKLGFVDTIEPIANFFIKTLEKEYEVVRDDINPDYLIFGDLNFGNNNMKYNTRNNIKIFFTGENERPWNYSRHFGISFEHIDDANNYRLPIYVVYDYDNQHRNLPNSTNKVRKLEDRQTQNKFCSALVSNPRCEFRNQFFHKLSEYKQVDSAGSWNNNIGRQLDRGSDGVKIKFDFLNNYKFNLCFENSSYPGYATEKVYEALCCNTIPIYWGSPTVEMDFNPKAFLSWHDYQDDAAFIEAIKELDQNEDKYNEMFLQPMFRDGQSTKFFDLDRFVKWFDKNVYKGVLNG